MQHWVWCSTATGEKVPVNLELVATMARQKAKGPDGGDIEVTALFYGHAAALPGGGVHYANSQVLETPEEIFMLERVDVAPSRAKAKSGWNV